MSVVEMESIDINDENEEQKKTNNNKEEEEEEEENDEVEVDIHDEEDNQSDSKKGKGKAESSSKKTTSTSASAASSSSSSASTEGSSSSGDESTTNAAMDDDDEPQGFYAKCIEPRMNKGFISNSITFLIMIIGLIIKATAPGVAADYILAAGLFGFSGGITNWLAVKMLFDKVPGLAGSGVIPTRFKEIRETVKNTMMKTFFDVTFLEKYIKQKTGQLTANLNIEEKIGKMLESEAVDKIIETKLQELSERPEGMMFAMMGVNPTSLKPLIKPFVLGMGSDIAPLMLDMFNPTKMMNIDKVRAEIDNLMTTKLEELTPEIVKKLMEEVIRKHLGWLIVWGNVFGGLIGVVSKLAGY
eukprot:TRINITY_DN726_c2_g1_i3.p1 TRINITY_DN726_c2_g1~~TRINITY_DN726_c2_g1_i3.p1  ORF type:complete len:357 (-),score=105.64 TRINITY_DN726_c2_g1_i3:74-1144(-)